MANWIKGICYLETHINPNDNGDGIMQLEGGTMSTITDLGYLSPEFFKSHATWDSKNKCWKSNLSDINAQLYASIGCFVANISAWQGPDGRESTGMKNLQSWISNRTDKNGNVSPALINETRLIYACGSYGPGKLGPKNTYNKNHKSVTQLIADPFGWERAYGIAIKNLVRQGRSPYSYQNEGAPTDSESSSSLFLP